MVTASPVTPELSVTRLGWFCGDALAGLSVPNGNKALGDALEQPQRARMVHKVKGVTLGGEEIDE